MTERGLPIVDGAAACPFVAFDDARDDRSDRPDPRHRCYAENPPAPRARAHQEAYCLSANFPVCPTFQDWARREAARVTSSGGAANPAERLRDVPAQRAAGERPAAFDRPDRLDRAAAAAGAAGAAGPARVPDADTVIPRPEAGAGPGEAALDAIITPEPEGGAEPVRQPWDLPPRRSVPPDWTAPPPWAGGGPAAGGSTAPLAPKGPGSPPSARGSDVADADASGISRAPLPEDIDAPDFLRAQPPPTDRRIWGRRPGEDSFGVPVANAGEDPEEAESREAVISRLRAMGMDGEGTGRDEFEDPAAGARPVVGTTRNVDRLGGVYDPERAPIGTNPSTAGVAGRAGAGGMAAGLPGMVPPVSEPPRRASSGLARILGWDRRPKAGVGRDPKVEREPSWERPRRYEAYPTLKTRVGVGAPSRLLLYAAALLVAAVVLFFVPPLLLKQGGVAGPGGSSSADPSATPSGSTRQSVAPTTAPTPKQVTYTVRAGDTLSTIAKRFKVTVEQILAANKNIKNPNKIAVGDVIIIPTPTPSEITDAGPSPT